MGSVQGPIVFIIRHGEKPAKQHGEDPIGLSKDGQTRADALEEVFGKGSIYDIRYILAQQPEDDGGRDRPWMTVKPLADSLGTDVLVNHTIDRDDAEGVVDAVRAYQGDGNVLVCWEHHALTKIVKAFGVPHESEQDRENITYPDDRFDVIWTLLPPYDQINEKSSEHTSLDVKYKDDP